MGIRVRPMMAAFLSVLMMSAFVPPAGATGGSMLQTDCDNPPDIMSVADVEPGMTGKAYTTLQGREISEFDVEVLGVLPGAIYPLIDLIIAEISGPAVEAVGGLAGGFSGSPVYLDGDLVGAIAYGFFGNAFIAGITPAEAMADLLAVPASPLPTSTGVATSDAQMVDAAVGSLGTPRPLPVPLGIGGVSPSWLEKIEAELDARGLRYTTYPATGSGSGGGGSTSPGRILPGESMSAVLSEGDNFAFGTGTATYCDGDAILGFGHPFFWTGEVTMSLNEADVVTVIENSTGFGNFKLLTLGEAVGRVDFDGNAGIRGIAGEDASSVPITSSVQFAELGMSRDGRTDAYLADDPFFSLGFTAAFHLLTNLDYVSGTGFRPGSSMVEWTVEGARADGSSFSTGFDNRYWDPFSITDASIFELAFFIDQLLFNPFEDVKVTSVDIGNAELLSERNTLDMTDVRVWTTSNPDPVEGFGFLQAQPGDTVTIEVGLRPFGGDEFFEMIELEIPEDFPGGFGSLFVHGGSSDFFFFDPFFDGFAGGEIDDFDGLLEFLEGRDHNYDLVAELNLFAEGFIGEPVPDGEGPEPPDGFVETNGPIPGDSEILRIKEVVEFDAVVNGDAFFDLEVFPEFVPPPVFGTLFAELGGGDVPSGGDSDGSGLAVLSFEGDLISFDIDLEGVDGPITGIHIHAGFEGEEGPVVIDLEYDVNGLSGVVFADPFLLEEMLFFPEGFYLQVHTEAYPAGAVRGQLATELVAGVTLEASTLAYVGSGGLWQTVGSEPFFFGVPGDTPFMGDWNGDGVKTPALYRPSSGFAYLRNSNTTGFADGAFFMGVQGDMPMVGDWDGDGRDTFGVFRPSDGKVYLRNSNDTGIADVEYSFGNPGDVPFTGDFNGDGVTDIGLHRASTGLVYMRTSHTTGVADIEFYWGVGGDVVMAGDWNGDGIDTVGLVRPDEGMFYLRNQNTLGMADDSRRLAVADSGVRVIVN